MAAIAAAEALKSQGNDHFRCKEYDEAVNQYHQALEKLSGNQTREARNIRSTLHSNSAACLLKLSRFEEALQECLSGLELGIEGKSCHQNQF